MRVESTCLIYDTKYLRINSSRYYDNQENSNLWFWAERPNNTSAIMVAATFGDKLVLIKEFRVPLNDYIWGLPAGLVEKGESPEDTAAREITEETGLTIKKLTRTSSSMTYTSPGLTNEGLVLVFAEVEGTPSNKLQEASEDIEVHVLSRVEVASILQSGEKVDSKAYLVMLRYVEDGKV
jgi:ADP-ribose pyrophosphatase